MKSARSLSASAMSAVVSSLFSLRSAIRPTIAVSAAPIAPAYAAALPPPGTAADDARSSPKARRVRSTKRSFMGVRSVYDRVLPVDSLQMPRARATPIRRKPSTAARAFLFSDLRDYTSYVEAKGDAAAARLLREYRTLVRREVARHDGGEVKTEG